MITKLNVYELALKDGRYPAAEYITTFKKWKAGRVWSRGLLKTV